MVLGTVAETFEFATELHNQKAPADVGPSAEFVSVTEARSSVMAATK